MINHPVIDEEEDCIDVDAHPLAWSKMNDSKHPHVAKLAKQYIVAVLLKPHMSNFAVFQQIEKHCTF